MVEENISWIGQRQSAWHSLNFNCLDVDAAVRQPVCVPAYVSPHIVPANAGVNCYNTSDTPIDEGIQIKDEGLFVQNHCFPRMETSIPAMGLYQNKQQPPVPGKATPHETSSYCQQKKFLIFDRSGEETRMLLSTLYSPICNPTAISPNSVSKHEFPEEICAFKPEQSCPKVPCLFGDSGENHVTDEGSDYREDSDEIDALLYSENDDDDDFCDSEDGDEISTGHSPVAMESDLKNLEEGEEYEEVTSLVSSSKRHKLLNGESFVNFSSADTIPMEKSVPLSFTDESEVDLNSSNGEQGSPTVGCKRSRGHKIHDTLRILQKLLPGSNSKDPLIIIDEAIDYLKSLKATSPNMEEEEEEEEAEGSSWLGPCL